MTYQGVEGELLALVKLLLDLHRACHNLAYVRGPISVSTATTPGTGPPRLTSHCILRLQHVLIEAVLIQRGALASLAHTACCCWLLGAACDEPTRSTAWPPQAPAQLRQKPHPLCAVITAALDRPDCCSRRQGADRSGSLISGPGRQPWLAEEACADGWRSRSARPAEGCRPAPQRPTPATGLARRCLM